MLGPSVVCCPARCMQAARLAKAAANSFKASQSLPGYSPTPAAAASPHSSPTATLATHSASTHSSTLFANAGATLATPRSAHRRISWDRPRPSDASPVQARWAKNRSQHSKESCMAAPHLPWMTLAALNPHLPPRP